MIFFLIFATTAMHFLALAALLVIGRAAKIPKSWSTCKKSDPEMNQCLLPAINGAIADLMDGNRNLGVLPLNPLHFDAITIDQGSGPVSIKLDFTDLDLKGLKDFKATNVNTDWDNMEIEVAIPTAVLDGHYKITGKVLILPINGDGHCKLILEKFRGVGYLKFSVKNIDGKNYYNVDSVSFTFDVDRLRMSFENLFNGDKALGDNMNRFLNDNWKEILGELKPSISMAFGAAIKEIANRVFSKIELDVISPP